MKSFACVLQCVQKWPCKRGNDKGTLEISSRDIHEWIMDWISQGDYPKMQISTPFQLCEFCHFWLRYTTLNGVIPRVLWQMMQGCLNLVAKRWIFVWEARMRSYESFLGQSWWEFEKNRPATTGKRPLCLDDFSPLTTLYRDCITCIVHSIMKSRRN